EKDFSSAGRYLSMTLLSTRRSSVFVTFASFAVISRFRKAFVLVGCFLVCPDIINLNHSVLRVDFPTGDPGRTAFLKVTVPSIDPFALVQELSVVRPSHRKSRGFECDHCAFDMDRNLPTIL